MKRRNVSGDAAQVALFSDDVLAVRREGSPPAEVAEFNHGGAWNGFALRADPTECGSCHAVRHPFGAAVVEDGKPSTLVCMRCTVRIVTERRCAGEHVCEAYAWVTEAVVRRFYPEGSFS